MVIDPIRGTTLQQVCDLVTRIILANKDKIIARRDELNKYYDDIPDDALDALENKEQLTPEDIKLLLRATALDHEFYTSKELPEDFNDRFNKSVGNLFDIRRRYRPKKEEQNGGTINPDDNTAN